MTVLSREGIKKPTLRRETVTVPALGGDVVVRGLMLSEHIETSRLVREVGQGAAYPWVLSCAVLADDGQPLYTAQEWEAWGSENRSACESLFVTACKLSGINLVEKKETTDPS